jgi:hypothetical protein
MRKDVAIYFMLIGGFATLFLDIRYEHRDVLHQIWQSYIPLGASFVAIAATLLALRPARGTQRAAAALFFLVALVGLGGVYYHTRLRAYMFTRYFAPIDEGKGPDGLPKLKGLQRPTFAPLAFTGLGLVGLILVLPGLRWPERSTKATASHESRI